MKYAANYCELTRKDLKRIYGLYDHCVTGYCCEQNAPEPENLVKLGYNAGAYGWNWSIFADASNDCIYVSYYRNVPSYIKEK